VLKDLLFKELRQSQQKRSVQKQAHEPENTPKSPTLSKTPKKTEVIIAGSTSFGKILIILQKPCILNRQAKEKWIPQNYVIQGSNLIKSTGQTSGLPTFELCCFKKRYFLHKALAKTLFLTFLSTFKRRIGHFEWVIDKDGFMKRTSNHWDRV
jgi:hypothetical protein